MSLPANGLMGGEPEPSHRFSTVASHLALALVLCVPVGAAETGFDRIAGALNPQACGGSGCWTNHLRVTDLDADGDLDIVLVNYPDFFDGANSPQPLVIYTNDGSANFTNVSATAVGNHSGNHRQIAIGDVTGDGLPDIFAPDATGAAYVLFVNSGSGVFANQASTRLPGPPYPAAAAARMGDVDGDGDLDLFVADGYAATAPPFGHLYRNDGAGVFVEVAGAIPSSISGVDIDDVQFFDADRDFDLDLVVNAHSGGTGALWLNDGTGHFAAGGSIDPPGFSAFHYHVTPCDVDGDLDLDLWVDNIGTGFTEQLLINDGAAHFDDQTASRVTGNPGADDNGVICADIDDDGDLDAVVVSLGTPERLLENDGEGNFTFVSGFFPLPTDCSLWAELGDLNGDGRFDLVTGQGECSSSDEVYLANAKVPVDSRPPVILAVRDVGTAAEGEPAVVIFGVQDRVATDEGPRLKRAFVVVDPEGSATSTEATFMGGDLFRVALLAAPGTVTYEACAEDPTGNIGCSEAQIFEVVGPIFADGFESGDTSAWSAP